MSDHVAFKACYADWKLIRTRSVVQVVLEIPLEAAGQAYDVLGGMPNPAAETWCAVARLDPQRAAEGAAPAPASAHAQRTQTAPAPVQTSTHASLVRARRPVAIEKRLAQQAGICCADPVFQTFLYEHDMLKDKSEEAATLAVRLICSVQSRSEIMLGTPAAALWDGLYSKFIAWREAA